MAAKTAIKEPKRSSALVRRETFASYCFLLPSLIFFLGFAPSSKIPTREGLYL